MWGGRFASGPGAIMQEINASIDFDRRLYRQDIAASKAHAAMLAKQGIISRDDAREIAHGLDTILSEMETGKFRFKRALEDIHMNVESRLAELIGPSAGRLHTARSRNDQVATDFKLWVRDAIDDIDAALAGYQQALAEKALAHAATVMPGFTHLQTAQPVTFGHHLLAYVEMAARDRGRFADARKRLNESPLGAAALAGTSFRLDRAMTAKALGFDRAGREFARRGVRPRLRDGDARRRLDHGGAPVALCRRDRAVVLAARRLRRRSRTSSPPAHRSCRRSAIRTRPNWCAPRPGASSARCRPLDGDEGTAARLPEGHAGGQGERDGCALGADARHRGDDRHGGRHDARMPRA